MHSSPCELKIVSNRRMLRDFIFLPEKIHAKHSNWLPPIYVDEWKFHNPKFNYALQHSDCIRLLAFKDGKITGRIMGIINKQYNALRKEQIARFYALECFDDAEVSKAMLNGIEAWARSKGMKEIIGPFGFSDKDPQGLQVEGFDHTPVIATATNLPYLPELVEQNGFTKIIDCVVYKLDVPDEIPALYAKVNDRVQRNGSMNILEFQRRKDLKRWIVPVFRLVNETYKDLFGFVPLSEKEMKNLAQQYLIMLDPEFTKLVIDNAGNPVGFIVASPDISAGIIKAKGRIFPFGFIHILGAGKKSRQLDLFLGAVKEENRTRGVTAMLGTKLFESAIRRKMKFIDSHLILETNTSMRAVMERLGAMIYKRYRIYHKQF